METLADLRWLVLLYQRGDAALDRLLFHASGWLRASCGEGSGLYCISLERHSQLAASRSPRRRSSAPGECAPWPRSRACDHARVLISSIGPAINAKRRGYRLHAPCGINLREAKEFRLHARWLLNSRTRSERQAMRHSIIRYRLRCQSRVRLDARPWRSNGVSYAAGIGTLLLKTPFS